MLKLQGGQKNNVKHPLLILTLPLPSLLPFLLKIPYPLPEFFLRKRNEKRRYAALTLANTP